MFHEKSSRRPQKRISKESSSTKIQIISWTAGFIAGITLGILGSQTEWKETYQAVYERTGNSAKELGQNEILANISAYTPRIQETDDSPLINAMGLQVQEGDIACPRFIELGTQVEIDNVVYTCRDRMNARYANTYNFDIFMYDLNSAKTFGRQIKIIKIIKIIN